MSFLRTNQRALTALSPHNANQTHYMPNFGKDFNDGAPVAGNPVPPVVVLAFTFGYRIGGGGNVDDIFIDVETNGGVGPQVPWDVLAETVAFWDLDRFRTPDFDPVNVQGITRENANTTLVFEVPNGFFDPGDNCRIDKNTDTPGIAAAEITGVLVGVVPP